MLIFPIGPRGFDERIGHLYNETQVKYILI